ncbi:MAG: cyclic nucleotide-binding domain-containing protein [Polyangiaceae bacterium]|jgi:CRP/FNR family cyclic AMP-dependent transcriptional regulator|nr:cyclic nucleotide-binding domain-containing protein [Polyangiaceae bacterium]MBK8938355.1 cyclic nucleotide-binding domain-containing protein [Polyangiaceae bacterium]
MPAPSDAPSLDQLAEIGLFGGLDKPVLEEFVQRLPILRLMPGEVVFREGETGRELFVLLQGEMEVVKQSKSQRESRVAMFGPGDWFGEMSILDVMPRSATVRALAPAQVLKMSASDLEALYRRDIKAYAIVVLNVAREMSRRLRVADAILADVMANLAETYSRRG